MKTITIRGIDHKMELFHYSHKFPPRDGNEHNNSMHDDDSTGGHEPCLVLQAGSIGRDGNIYVLDMGKPIKIKDLAENLIILSGLTPGVDIKINYTGIRAGEKLIERLFYDNNAVESVYRGIYIERNSIDQSFILDGLETIAGNIYQMQGNEINSTMDQIINLHSVTRTQISPSSAVKF